MKSPRRRFTDDRIVRPYDPHDEVMSGCIIFAGRSINLNRLSTQEKFNYQYLWRIFNGLRTPSLSYIERLAAYLHMTRNEFLDELDKSRLGQSPPAQE